MAETPQTRTRRRPHLAPIMVPLLIALAAGAGIWWLGTSARTSVVLLVRHAEAQSAASGDPDLSKAGEARVRGLGEFIAGVLAGDKVDYLYAADTRRAQQTAAPIANEFKLPVNLLASSDWAGFASRVKREHRGKVVVDDDYDSIFLVVMPSPGPTRVFRLRYGPPETRPATAR
jgi:Histidine phosphatase superfamily (branch 1)